MSDEVDVVIPLQLKESVDKLMDGLIVPGDKYAERMAYIGGWILGGAKKHYRDLVQRDGLPEDPKVIRLLCEIAVLRALVEWHEVRDRPPPMPTIANL